MGDNTCKGLVVVFVMIMINLVGKTQRMQKPLLWYAQEQQKYYIGFISLVLYVDNNV